MKAYCPIVSGWPPKLIRKDYKDYKVWAAAMNDFEFIFALFSLLLGLSMVELLSGLGRALETRFTAASGAHRFQIGTPIYATVTQGR